MLAPWKKSYDQPRQHIKKLRHYFVNSSVQSLSRVWLFVIPWTAACQTSLSINNFQSLFKLMSIESLMPSNHLILCHPLLPPSVFPSIRVFSSESVLRIMWPKHWNFCFSISSYNEYSGLISLMMDWLALLVVQGTLKSLLQHHRSKASILWCSVFFIVQLSHPYMTTGKIIALTRWTFVGKVMSLLLNMLSRLVITFLPRSKHLLISWLHHCLQWFWSPTFSFTMGRSPGGGCGNPLQYSCLENPMDRGASWAAVCGIAKNRTRLSD